jgi:hypothetical protein
VSIQPEDKKEKRNQSGKGKTVPGEKVLPEFKPYKYTLFLEKFFLAGRGINRKLGFNFSPCFFFIQWGMMPVTSALKLLYQKPLPLIKTV